MSDVGRDRWAEWLLQRRFGGDPDELRRTLDYLYPIRDRVLANARVGHGQTLLDIGTGDGLIAFAALEQVGDRGRVIFSDVSQDLLDHDRLLAERFDAGDRCRFVRASADDLAPIGDASVDIVTTRSVLIYVADKQRALDEFFRVLRPNGHVSLFEPINRFSFPEPPHRFMGFDVTPVGEIAAKLVALFRRHQPLDTDPMMNFDERDLLAHAERAGFAERHLEFRVDVEPLPPRSWETFAATAFNPLIPTLAEAMRDALTPEEADRFSAHLRPLVERGDGALPLAVAYLWAVKR